MTSMFCRLSTSGPIHGKCHMPFESLSAPAIRNMHSPHFLYRNIFLGETFSSYISVHNDSNQVVKDILVKVTARVKW